MAAKKKTEEKKRARIQLAGVQPTTRTYVRWTLAQIRSAEVTADSGNLRYAANLSDWIMADDRVQGTLDTRVQSLLGLDPIFEASGDRRRSKKAVNALELEEDWWASYDESEIAQMMKWGIILGCAPLRHRWLTMPGHGDRILPKPEFWHPQHLRYDYSTRKWMISVSDMNNPFTREEVLTPGDGTWILHAPHGLNRPWASGAWRGLAPFVLMKHLAIQDWMVHSERASLLVGTQDAADIGLGEAPVGDDRSTERERQDLAQHIYDRGREAVIILPPGFDLKLVEAQANTEQLYRSQIAIADTAIAVQIRGGNLTTEVQSGSRAAAEAQERLGDEVKRRFDGQAATTTLHDQSLVYWALHNFGDMMLAPWPVYPSGPRKDQQARAASLDAAAKCGMSLQKLGYTIDPEGFAEEFELRGLVDLTAKWNPQILLDQELAKKAAKETADKADEKSPPRTSPDTFAERDKEIT